MIVVALALILVAVTAAVVIRDVQTPPPRHLHHGKNVPARDDPFDMPTQAVDMSGLLDGGKPDDEHSDPPTADVELPVLEAAAASVAPGLVPVPSTAVPIVESDHLIQTEVLQAYGERVQALALSKLLLGIAGSGVVVGLVIIALVRGIEALIRAG
ncbi:MAG: hypothetical protein ACXVQY_08955 [Actinomycetota bacterium]